MGARRRRRLLHPGDEGADRRPGRAAPWSPRAARRTRSRAAAERARPTRRSGGRRCARRSRETGRAGEVAAISVAGQQHGLVVLDADGAPAAPRRAVERHALGAATPRALRDGLGAEAWAERIGVVPVPSFTVTRGPGCGAPSPRSPRRPARSGSRTTGSPSASRGRGATDRGDASGTGWWSTRDEDYVDEVLDARRARRARCCRTCSGRASRPARSRPPPREQLGLPRRAPSSGRAPATTWAPRSASALRPGEPVISLGTSGTAYAAMSERARRPDAAPSPGSRTRPAASCRWRRRSTARSPSTGSRALARARPRGRRAERTAVTVLPYLDGERTPNLPHAGGHDRRPAPRHRAGADPAGRLRGRGGVAASRRSSCSASVGVRPGPATRRSC